MGPLRNGQGVLVTPDDLAERRRRREALLAQRASSGDWRSRLLARRTKHVRAHQILAHRLSQQS